MAGVTDESPISHRYRLLAPHFTEDELRKWAAVEAASYGPGGITILARITGIAAPAIRRAQRELQINKTTANTSSARAPARPKNSEQ
jgi:hypothetical protein